MRGKRHFPLSKATVGNFNISAVQRPNQRSVKINRLIPIKSGEL